jgi:predicted  nucleic acid-binding Zn-ribbon protein
MEQKIKYIIAGLVGLCVICLFLFLQAFNQQQRLLRESNDLKAENSSLQSKANKLESDLKSTQNNLSSLQDERDRKNEELNELQRKFETAARARDELAEALKQKNRVQVTVPVVQAAQRESVPANTDAYWGSVLQAKTDLEMQMSSIQSELRKLQISNDSLQRAKSVLELDINSLRNDKKDLLRQLDYTQKLLDSMSQEVVRERNDKVAIQDNLKIIRAENNVLSRQLKSLVARKEALDKKVQSLQEDKNTAEKRLSEMESMLGDRISKIDSLKNELNAITSGTGQDWGKVAKASVELPAIVVRSTPAAGQEQAQINESSGKILAVNLESNFVVIDLGSSAGVKVGNVFGVYRDARSVGSIEVIQVRPNIAACDIKRSSTALKIGDRVN